MKEPARLKRNQQRLTECFPTFATPMRRVLDSLEAQGFRPRIQDAWRSEADQRIAFENGNSNVLFGFHNVTGAGGVKESLACDVLDDDNPTAPPTRYLLALTLAARAQGLDTLIMMKLKPPDIAAVEAVLAAGDINRPVKVGKDPTHVQPTGITIAKAKAGARPGAATVGAQPAKPPQPRPEEDDMTPEQDALLRDVHRALDELGRPTLGTVQDITKQVAKLDARLAALEAKFAAGPG